MSAIERVKGIQVHRPIIYGSHARLLTEEEKSTAPAGHTHRWTVFLTSATSTPPERLPSGELVKESIDYLPGGVDDLSYLIKRITFKLHDTYPSPNRAFDKPPFAVTETGWGEFVVQIRIQFIPESSEKPLTLNHPIKLHHWGLPIENPSTTSITNLGEGSTAPNSTVSTPAPAPPPSNNETQTQTDTQEVKSTDVDEKKDGEQKDKVKKENENPISAAGGEGGADQKKDGEIQTQGDSSMVLEPTQTSETQQTGGDISTDSQPAVDPQSTSTPQPQQPISIASILPVHSWQYDEIIFSDPPKVFLDILNENPPTPLPNRNRRPTQREEYDPSSSSSGQNRKNKKSRTSVTGGRSSIVGSRANTEFGTPIPTTPGTTPLQTQNQGVISVLGIPGELGSADIPLEFSLEMERSEHNKLSEARKKIVDQMDKWRERLIAQEKELNKLKEEVKSM